MDCENMLAIEAVDQDGIRIVKAHGEVDICTAPAFEKALVAGLELTDRYLIVDLSDLSYIDSAGLGALLNTHRKLSAKNKELVAVAPTGHSAVWKVLEITRFDRIFKVRRSLDEALEEARPPET